MTRHPKWNTRGNPPRNQHLRKSACSERSAELSGNLLKWLRGKGAHDARLP
jgi:hypothetical protein